MNITVRSIILGIAAFVLGLGVVSVFLANPVGGVLVVAVLGVLVFVLALVGKNTADLVLMIAGFVLGILMVLLLPQLALDTENMTLLSLLLFGLARSL